MRYIGLILFILSIPLLAGMLKANSTARRCTWVLLGMSPFIYGWLHLTVSVVSWAYWPGYVKGLVVSLPDLIAIGILLAIAPHRIRYGIPAAFCIYIAAAASSMIVSQLPFASFQYVWQLLRIFLLAVAVARASGRLDAPQHIIYGLCYGVIFQSGFSVFQRLGSAAVQASGTMGHQNLLGMLTHFALLAAMALILAGDKAIILKVGVGAALVVVALTGSRGTVGFASAGVVSLMVLSLIRHPTAKKMRVAGAGLVVLLALSPVAYFTLEKRFASASDNGGYDERLAFEHAALAMWSDHPLGVGANEYVVVANTQGYSSRAGVASVAGSRSANVHNAYLLIAAETGWPGIIAFLFLYGVALFSSFSAAWSRPYTRDSELLLGVSVALSIVAAHSLYEWIFVTEVMQYVFGIMLGFAMGLKTERIRVHAGKTIASTARIPVFMSNTHAPT